MKAPDQGQGVVSQRRPHGVASAQTAIPAGRKKPVYLLAQARPANRPAASHHPPAPPRTSRPSDHTAATQNSSSGVSGVMITDPAPANSVALNNAPAISPARRFGSRCSAASASSQVPSATDNGPSSRTPSAPSPARLVPRRIHSATIGG